MHLLLAPPVTVTLYFFLFWVFFFDTHETEFVPLCQRSNYTCLHNYVCVHCFKHVICTCYSGYWLEDTNVGSFVLQVKLNKRFILPFEQMAPDLVTLMNSCPVNVWCKGFHTLLLVPNYQNDWAFICSLTHPTLSIFRLVNKHVKFNITAYISYISSQNWVATLIRAWEWSQHPMGGWRLSNPHIKQLTTPQTRYWRGG